MVQKNIIFINHNADDDNDDDADSDDDTNDIHKVHKY